MPPTDSNAKPRPVRHAPLVVMSPAGGDTFGVECLAGDWLGGSEISQTQHEARYSRGVTEHVMKHLHRGECRVAVLPSPVDLTFTPRCLAGDFMTEDVFDTLKEARASKAINEHVERYRPHAQAPAVVSPARATGPARPASRCACQPRRRTVATSRSLSVSPAIAVHDRPGRRP